MRAIRINAWGGPEVLELAEDAPCPSRASRTCSSASPAPAINFADTHARENSYLARYELPLVPGAEVAGVVERDGHGFRAGQRVVALVGTGGYAEYVAAPAATTFAVPDGVERRRRRSRCCCRASPRGTCTAPRRASRRARASSCTPPPAASARSPSSSASRSAPAA